jgi:hypothetical protein
MLQQWMRTSCQAEGAGQKPRAHVALCRMILPKVAHLGEAAHLVEQRGGRILTEVARPAGGIPQTLARFSDATASFLVGSLACVDAGSAFH